MTTNNHPAHGPVLLDRLHQISKILSKAEVQSDGGNLGYAMADAVKVINGAIEAFGAKPVAYLYSASFERGHVEGELTDAPGCDMPVYTATPAPVSVPDELTREEYKRRFMEEDNFDDTFRGGWNACRAAMLRAGNSPVTPDGSTTGLFNSARALLDALYEFGPDEIAISEHVTNLEDALRNAAAPQEMK